jgi:hypothetical protein
LYCSNCRRKKKIDNLDDLVLFHDEKTNKWTLSCNVIPTTDVKLDIEDQNGVHFGQILFVDIRKSVNYSFSLLNCFLWNSPLMQITKNRQSGELFVAQKI